MGNQFDAIIELTNALAELIKIARRGQKQADKETEEVISRVYAAKAEVERQIFPSFRQ